MPRWSGEAQRTGPRFSQWEKLSAKLTDEGVGTNKKEAPAMVPLLF